jgi:hypothetical protein
MTQTAVEWFQEQIIEIVNGRCELSEIQIFEQAKEMEKQQIIDAANTILYHSTGPGNTAAEKYYNETFNN